MPTAIAPYVETMLHIVRETPGLTAHEILNSLLVRHHPVEEVPTISTIRRALSFNVKNGTLTSDIVGANTKRFYVRAPTVEEEVGGALANQVVEAEDAVQSQTREDFEDHALAEEHSEMFEPQSDRDTGFSASGADFSTGGFNDPMWNVTQEERDIADTEGAGEADKERAAQERERADETRLRKGCNIKGRSPTLAMQVANDFDKVLTEEFFKEMDTRYRCARLGIERTIVGHTPFPRHGPKVQVRKGPDKHGGRGGNSGHSGQRTGATRSHWFHLSRSERKTARRS